ncbi:hypothetical protein TcBrA4_0105370 [Trypanosoma cruzi]|nr:hypothetical protein TcBrA4_0105370 [Trypanosoma cruzi]
MPIFERVLRHTEPEASHESLRLEWAFGLRTKDFRFRYSQSQYFPIRACGVLHVGTLVSFTMRFRIPNVT